MGQYEVLDLLRKKRKESDSWFTATQIFNELREKGKTSKHMNSGKYDDLYKLTAFGQIQFKGEGLWKHTKLFRAYKF